MPLGNRSPEALRTEEALSQLQTIDKTDFESDAKGRVRAFLCLENAARRLEPPWFRSVKMAMIDPIFISAIKPASDLNLFEQLSDQPRSVSHLSNAVGADPALMSRLMRLLVSFDVVQSGLEEGTFTATEFSTLFRDRDGLGASPGVLYGFVQSLVVNVPRRLREGGYQNPQDVSQPAFQPKGGAGFWTFLQQHPQINTDFNNFLASTRTGQLPWTDCYPVTQLLEEYDASSGVPFAVNVGGGSGQDLRQLVRAFPDEYVSLPMMLQDLEPVIAGLRKAQQVSADVVPPSTVLIAHDFMEPQPRSAIGARVFILREVLHDWPDQDARKILSNIKEAMTPGYTRILLSEIVMAEKMRDVDVTSAVMDWLMMSLFSSLERTEKQWEALLKSEGLTLVKVWRTEGSIEAILEVVLEKL